MRRIKNTLNYYSNFITSINKHVHASSVKLTKLISLTEQINKNVEKEKVLVISQDVMEVKFSKYDVYYSPKYMEGDFAYYIFINDKNIKFDIQSTKKINYFPTSLSDNSFFSKNGLYSSKIFENINSIGNFIVPANQINYYLNNNFEFNCSENSNFENINFTETISFIVPVYNVEDYVEETIESILCLENLESDNFEIIIIDDKSTDKSLEKINKYSNYENIKILKNTKNLGLGATRNVALSHATKNWISFVDSDDLLNEKLYREFCKVLPTNPTAEIAMFKLCLYDGENKKWHLANEKLKNAYNNTMLSEENKMLPIYDTSACTKFFRRNLMKDFKFPHTSYEDGIMSSFLAGKKILILDCPGYYYRKMDQVSITSTRGNTLFEKFSSVVHMTINNVTELENMGYDKEYIKEYLQFSFSKRVLAIEKWLHDYCKDYRVIWTKNFSGLKKLSIFLSQYEIENKYELLQFCDSYDEYIEVKNEIKSCNIMYDKKFYLEISDKIIIIPSKYIFTMQNGYVKFYIKNRFDVINLTELSDNIYKYESCQATIMIENMRGKYEKKYINI